ncbi:MAG TPA: ComEA family DNA-binding protein [Acidimicrobiia bacterium]|jgi:competence protein ComEA|nr:ComEA family DNA-binding protein [Acidimicrobiia bacterium]
MADSPRTDTVERGAPDAEFWASPDHPDRPPVFPPRPGEWGGPLERFVDRVRELRGDPRVGVAALVVVALAAGFIWYRLGAGDSASSSTARRPPATSARTTVSTAAVSTADSPANGGSSGGTKKGARVTVHVAGAVAKPGVYDLAGGARVIDAIEAAGGGAPDADLNRLNLAAKVADGQRVLVQRAGEAAPAGSAGAGGSGTGGGSADPSGLVNLNSATQAELEALPGIGPSLAGSIVTERERRGGFRSVNELRDVRGIGEKRFADLKDKVTI